jgi:hypothetical protein
VVTSTNGARTAKTPVFISESTPIEGASRIRLSVTQAHACRSKGAILLELRSDICQDKAVKSMLLAAALGLAVSAQAIEVTGSRGTAQERDSVHGTITHIDGHSVTIHWMASPSFRMRSHSYSQTYQFSATTQCQGCSLASLKNGTSVLISGHGRTVDVIQIK